MRRLLGRLRPRQLDDLTLEQAIRSLMREMELESRGIVSHLDWRIDEFALSESQRVTLFRVCQEGLNNIVKHANASAVTLQGWQQDERLMLVIEDDGSGLPPGSNQQGFGLTGMRERITALGDRSRFPVRTARGSACRYPSVMCKERSCFRFKIPSQRAAHHR